MISKAVDKDEDAMSNATQYREVALTFSTDYDKENPLTSQQGQLRLLDIQIEQARKRGTQEDLANMQMLI